MIIGLGLMPWKALADAFANYHSFARAMGLLPLIFVIGATQPWPRRGHMQIIAELLEIASHGDTTKTALVYKANLNFTLVNRYLDHLEKRGLIQHVNGGQTSTYKLTEKGRAALDLLRRTMDEVLEEATIFG